jgi:hypothetical protein
VPVSNVYLVEWRCLGDTETTRQIITIHSVAELFEYFIDTPDIVYFAFEDVTETPIEEVERRLLYVGRYSL